MMNLVVHDLDGRIWGIIPGQYTIPNGVPSIEVEVPDGQYIKGVDVSVAPAVAILEMHPQSKEVERIDLLEQALNDILLGGGV